MRQIYLPDNQETSWPKNLACHFLHIICHYEIRPGMQSNVEMEMLRAEYTRDSFFQLPTMIT